MGKYIDSNGLSHLIGLFKPALLPSGGSAGQVLVKSSATDYDASWVTSSGGGSDKVDTESTNGTDTATIYNANGAIEIAVTDGTDTSSVTVTPAEVTITTNGIDANRVMITGANGDVRTSSVTSTELSRLSGVTSNVQSQLDSKLNASSVEITSSNGYIYVLFSVDDDNKLQFRANSTTQAVRTKLSGTWSSWRTI